jgi:beta-glucosidase
MLPIAIVGLLSAMTPQIPLHVATTPADRLAEPWWSDRHKAALNIKSCDIAFLGDSITQGWESTGKATWDKYWAPLNAANFGFSGDRTEHVLWRLNNGELIPTKPKLIVILIGTNNVGHGSSNASQTNDGVRLIVKTLRDKLPQTKILLLGILPRGAQANDPMRLAVADATQQFKSVADGKMVRFLDIGKPFMNFDGSLRQPLMPDFLHLTDEGYVLWARMIERDVRDMLK